MPLQEGPETSTGSGAETLLPPVPLLAEPSSPLRPLPKHRSPRKRAFAWASLLPIILLSGLLVNWATVIPAAFALSTTTPDASGTMTYQRFLAFAQQQPTPPARRPVTDSNLLKPTQASQASQILPSIEPATMQDQTYVLDNSFVLNRPRTAALPAQGVEGQNPVEGLSIPSGTTPFVTTGNDGRLEVRVPRGSLNFANAHLASSQTPVGNFFLSLHQFSGHYIEASSILGTYQIQITDGLGNVVEGVQLTQPVTIVYHYQPDDLLRLNLNPNAASLAWSEPLAQARQDHTSTDGLVVPMTNDASAQTLTAQTTLLAGTMTVSGDPTIQTPATPTLFEASGNSGQYSYQYPLKVVPGPAGFTPQLALSYSSQSTNERYTRRAPAGQVGDGWSLGLGSISQSQYPSSSAGGARTWYSINGIDGVSDRLIPLNTSTSSVAGYYETQHVSHLRIYFNGGSFWQVWGKDGTYYELGNTANARQRTPTTATNFWYMNKIVAPAEATNQLKMMLITYLQDTPDSGATIRDMGIKQITYGYATSSSALSQTVGTINFHYHMPSVPSGESAFATAYGTNYHCSAAPPSSTTLRCDDPVSAGGVPAPAVMSTMSLDSVTSYVGADTTKPAYKYTLTYRDDPYSLDYWDSFTGMQQAAAGEHLLMKVNASVYVQGTAHSDPGMVFSYTSAHDSYEDPVTPGLADGSFGGQTFWYYLTHYQDLKTGVGANITYATAYANMKGTPYVTDESGNVIDDRLNPLYCTRHASDTDTSKRCSGTTYGQADTYSWSMQVVTQISALGKESSDTHLPVATTSYAYSLTPIAQSADPTNCHPLTGSGVPAQEASCTTYSWAPASGSNNHDDDWADFYHSEFRGFNAVYMTSSAGNLTADYYYTTRGWGTPSSDGLNFNGGQRYKEQIYQGNAPVQRALLREVDTDYPGVGDYQQFDSCVVQSPVLIYVPCVAAVLQQKTWFYDGTDDPEQAPWQLVQSTYDDLDTDTFVGGGSTIFHGYVSTGYHNLVREVTRSSNASTITKKWQYVTNNQTVNSVVYYVVDTVAQSEIDDSSGHVWQCQNTTYDEGSSLPTPAAGWPTTVKNYSDCSNQANTALTTYTGYDQYGNTVETVDPLGASHAGFYNAAGCGLGTAPVIKSAAWTASSYTTCSTYDTTVTASLPVMQQNVLGQTVTLAYDSTSALFPTSTTNANSVPSTYGVAYDGNGNETITVSQPGETGAYTTRQSEAST